MISDSYPVRAPDNFFKFAPTPESKRSGGRRGAPLPRYFLAGEGVFSASPAGYFAGGAAGGATGAPGIAGTPAGAGIDWTGAAPPLFMMLRVPPVPEK